jgi:hypothetical protein
LFSIRPIIRVGGRSLQVGEISANIPFENVLDDDEHVRDYRYSREWNGERNQEEGERMMHRRVWEIIDRYGHISVLKFFLALTKRKKINKVIL